MARWAGPLLALAFVLVLPAGVSAERDDCFPRRTFTLAHSDSGRVYTIGAEDEAVACLYESGIKRRLTTDDWYREAVGPFAIAGRFVAYHGRFCTEVGACYQDIYVIDVKTGKVVRESNTSGMTCEYSAVSAGSQCGSDDVRRVVVKRNGSTAWVTAEHPRAVWRLDAGGFRQLDKAKTIDARSLRLNDARTKISWIDAGRRRTALLR